MKQTTRLYDILESCYINRLKKLYPEYSISAILSESNFMYDAMTNSQLFRAVVRDNLFIGTYEILGQAYNVFTQEFCQHFLTRCIKFQTVEAFILRLNGLVLEQSETIKMIYLESSEYLSPTTISNTQTTDEATQGNKTFTNDLPQDMQTWDGDIAYASSADESRTTSSDNGTSQTVTTGGKSIGKTAELSALHKQLFEELDKRLFSQLV